MSTQGNPQGSIISLGWVHDGEVFFILTGTNGQFCSTNPPAAWMQANLGVLGSRPLRNICVPGSHDAGMYKLTGGTAFASEDLVLTQLNPIGTQLALGVRYFDLRPVITGGQFSTGHYSDLGGVLGWQGGNGQSFKDIITDINSFTTSSKELVILKLSHDLNTDIGHDNYRGFNQDEWNRLMNELTAIRNLFVAPNASTVDLADMTVSQFIGTGQAAVLVLVEPSGVVLGPYAERGFYKYSQFNLYDNYADTDNTDKMVNDQIQKMLSVRTSPNSQPFLLSWTLTQPDNAGAIFGPSIRQLAARANPALYYRLLPACTPSSYPNVLYIDAVTTSNIAVLAMVINNLASGIGALHTAATPLGIALAGLATANLSAIPPTMTGVVEVARAVVTAIGSNQSELSTTSNNTAERAVHAAAKAADESGQSTIVLSMAGAVALAVPEEAKVIN